MLKKRISKTIPPFLISIDDITVEVQRKNIKSLRLKVTPPDGKVSLSVPLFVRQTLLDDFISRRIHWIKQQQADIAAKPVKPQLQYVNGETVFYLGKPYVLHIIKANKQAVSIHKGCIELVVRQGSTTQQRERVINEWYREQLKSIIPELLVKWQPIINKQVNAWGVKKMKTRWGSCNIDAKRIWLNLELAKKPMMCIEMVLVHELVHLHQRYHNEHFYQLMTRFMPNWRDYDALLRNDDIAYEKTNS